MIIFIILINNKSRWLIKLELLLILLILEYLGKLYIN